MQDLIRKMPGIVSTRVGWAGGDSINATYRDHGTHAEAIEIVFASPVMSYRPLLEFFPQIHDPATPNRQGNDRSPHYRSAVYFVSDTQSANPGGRDDAVHGGQVDFHQDDVETPLDREAVKDSVASSAPISDAQSGRRSIRHFLTVPISFAVAQTGHLARASLARSQRGTQHDPADAAVANGVQIALG